jgi:hypothetical protein
MVPMLLLWILGRIHSSGNRVDNTDAHSLNEGPPEESTASILPIALVFVLSACLPCLLGQSGNKK